MYYEMQIIDKHTNIQLCNIADSNRNIVFNTIERFQNMGFLEWQELQYNENIHTMEQNINDNIKYKRIRTKKIIICKNVVINLTIENFIENKKESFSFFNLLKRIFNFNNKE